MTEDEYGILAATSDRLNISKSMTIRNLVIYHGLCGGEMPLTMRILKLEAEQRARVLANIRRRAEKNDPELPQKWKMMVQEALGADASAELRVADILLRKLLEE